VIIDHQKRHFRWRCKLKIFESEKYYNRLKSLLVKTNCVHKNLENVKHSGLGFRSCIQWYSFLYSFIVFLTDIWKNHVIVMFIVLSIRQIENGAFSCSPHTTILKTLKKYHT
jgi:hypothetical protein